MDKNEYKIKAVSFNLSNEEQQKLYEYTMENCANNFSRYIKDLIRQDRERKIQKNLLQPIQ